MEKEKIIEIVKSIEHPEIEKTLFQLGMIGDIKIENEKVTVELKVPFLQIPIKDYLVRTIEMAVKEKFSDVKIKIDVIEMTQEERMNFMEMAQMYWRR